jgi:YihY family inner membrane protein
VSTAAPVPETWEYTGDDPKETLARTGRLRLLESAFVRFRQADGTSHSRSLAFATSLVLVQSIVVLVGFAAAFGQSGVTSTIVETIRSAVPGPASHVLADAVGQANRVGHENRFLPLTIGLIGLLVTATTAMGQMERGLNRIYGIEKDRPSVRKYRLAFVLTLTVGTGLAIAFLMLGFGGSIGRTWGHEARVAWEVLRWPLGLVLIAVCLAAILSHSANRRKPGRAWLAFGSAVAVALWAASTIGLALAFRLSSTFGETYGPLAGIVALQLWTFLSAFSIFYGVAVAAELEAIRAGAGETSTARSEAPASEATTAAAPVSLRS